MSRILATFVILFASQSALAVDFETYDRLTSEADRLRGELSDALGGDDESALRREAVAVYDQLLEWYSDFQTDPEFAAMPAEQQAAVRLDEERLTYNRARHQLALGECAAARAGFRTLLEGSLEDDSLRPRITEGYDDSSSCVTEIAAAEPMTSESAESDHEHQRIAQSDDHNADLYARVDPVDNSPTWYEWTLWGAGTTGVAVGIAYVVDAQSRRSTIEDPPDGQVLSDPDEERTIIRRLERAGTAAIGIGVTAAIAGTVSYFVRDRDEGEPYLGVAPSADGAVLWLGGGF